MNPDADTPDDVHDRLIDAGKEQQRELLPWVVSQLNHPVDFVRGAALRTVAFYWRLPAFRALAATRFHDDPSDEVREIAAMCLGGYGYLSFSGDEMLAMVNKALDCSEPDAVRDAAFSAALVASRIDRDDYPAGRQVPDFEAKAPWHLLADSLVRLGLAVPEALQTLLAK